MKLFLVCSTLQKLWASALCDVTKVTNTSRSLCDDTHGQVLALPP